MKANELRIGNWVKTPYGKFIQVESVNRYGIDLITDERSLSWEHDIDKIDPIPLTYEILLKAGFERRMYNGKYIDEDERMLRYNHFVFTLEYNELRFGNVIVRLDYLHQLQNLYFALMCEELKINL